MSKILVLDNGTASVNGRTVHRDGTVIGVRGKPLAFSVSKDGYLRVKIVRNKSIKLHRLLALCFIPNPDNLETVNHKDGNKLNNALDNLEWMSRVDNLYHAMDNGTHAWGRREVRNNLGAIFKSASEAARHFGIAQSNITRAIQTKGNYYGMKWEYV
jgi:hypothetical protein